MGIGPGNYEDMTVRAVKTLEKCDVIVGYTVYADIIKPYFTKERNPKIGKRCLWHAKNCKIPLSSN